MRIFKDLDMVEQPGSGVPRILRVYSKDCFKFGDSFTRMVFPIETTVKSTQKIINLMKENKYITTTEIAVLLNRSRSAIAKQIAKMKAELNELYQTKVDIGK